MEIIFECKECNLNVKITKEQAKAHVALHNEMKIWYDGVLK